MKKVAVITTAFGYGLEDRARMYAAEFASHGLDAWYCTRDQLMSDPKEVKGVIVGVEKADKAFFDACVDLEVAMKFGVGLDNFNREYAQQKGVVVANLPGINSDAVAELAIGLMLSVSRQICTLNQECKQGTFTQICSHSILGKTLGIVGVGSIGVKVAKIAQAFNMKCLGFDMFPFTAEGIQPVDLESLLRESDIVSIHIPLTEANRHMFNAQRFAQMRQGSILINTSRGGIVDEPALAQAISEGRLAGAGLDVFESKETVKPLLACESVVCTPHVAAYTHETLRHMELTIIGKMAGLLAGK
jgi:D-3-phosphoglycerate dehydrogenase